METKQVSPGVVVVTGGTAGPGRPIVQEIASRGYDVAILALGQDGLDGAVVDVPLEGGRGLGIPTDIADVDAVDQVESELGQIIVSVNDAMVGVFGEFVTTEPADFDRAVRVNFFGFVNGTWAGLHEAVHGDHRRSMTGPTR